VKTQWIQPLLAIGYFCGLALFGLFCAFWSPIAWLLLKTPETPRRRHWGRKIIRLGFGIYLWMLRALRLLHLETPGLDRFNPSHATIVAPNHPSLLDAVILLSMIPDAGCVLKAKLLQNPLFGPAARLAGYVANEPTRSMIRKTVDELSAGGILLMFPEGSRTTVDPVNPLKLSPFLIAREAQVPVLTVFIESPPGFLAKDESLLRCPKLPIRIRVSLGESFPPDENPRALAHRITQSYQDALPSRRP
jgi:1-acyl-sn-glycerol-3-phosphate acyltransferase